MSQYLPKQLGRAFLLALLGLLLLPTLAFATSVAVPSPHLVLPVSQIWVVVVGLVTPLLGYVTNTTLWKNAPEPVKAFVQVLIAAVAAAITTAISTNVFGANNATLQLVITGVVAALSSHALLWRPGGVAAHLTTPRGTRVRRRWQRVPVEPTPAPAPPAPPAT